MPHDTVAPGSERRESDNENRGVVRGLLRAFAFSGLIQNLYLALRFVECFAEPESQFLG